MRLSTMCGMMVLGGLFLAASAMAQPAGGQRGRGMGMGMMGDPLQQLLTALGDVNLRPDFTLTKEQKEKIQSIRDGVKNAETKWRTDHAADLKKIQDDMQAARQDQDQDKMRETMTKARELMQSMPNTEEAAKEVRAVLTEDQAKALDARITERQEEMRARGGMMMGGMRGGRRGGNGGGGQ